MSKIEKLPSIDWDQQAQYARSVQETQAHNKRVEQGVIKGERRAIPKPPEGWVSKAQAERMLWEKMNEIIEHLNALE